MIPNRSITKINIFIKKIYKILSWFVLLSPKCKPRGKNFTAPGREPPSEKLPTLKQCVHKNSIKTRHQIFQTLSFFIVRSLIYSLNKCLSLFLGNSSKYTELRKHAELNTCELFQWENWEGVRFQFGENNIIFILLINCLASFVLSVILCGSLKRLFLPSDASIKSSWFTSENN